MPDPNDNNQQNNNQQTTTPTGQPVPAPVNDQPSVSVPDFLSTDSSSTTPPMVSGDQTPKEEIKTEKSDMVDANNQNTDQMPTISSTPKKKFGGGRIIATILGFLVLAGGIVGGVVLTQQNQNIEEKAAARDSSYTECLANHSQNSCDCEWLHDQTACDNIVTGGPGPYKGTGCSQATTQSECSGACSVKGYKCQWLTGSSSCKETTQACDGPPSENECPAGTSKSGCFDHVISEGCKGDQWCETQAWDCKVDNPTAGDVANNQANGSDACNVVRNGTYTKLKCSPDSRCGGKETPTASCQNVKAYNESYTLLSATDLTKLSVGDKVNFCVAGTTTQGTFDKARFTINGTQLAETTTKRPSSPTNEFCQNYEIPTGVKSFTITAQIHHPSLDWK